MTCKAVRTCLLGLRQPDRPPPDAAAHLAACGACREWHRRLVQLERHVPLLPVPASSAKARVVARILSDAPAPRAKPASPPPAWQERERRLKRLAISAALTAALVLIAVGLWAWNVAHDTSPGPAPRPAAAEDPLLASLMQRHLKLAAPSTPRQRVEVLTDLADDLHSEARALFETTSDTRDLAQLATMYQKVVHDGIVKQAKALPAAERPAALERASAALKRMGEQADALADAKPARAVPLRQIAAAARDGNRQLRDLMPG
jgi:hypothetical protein